MGSVCMVIYVVKHICLQCLCTQVLCAFGEVPFYCSVTTCPPSLCLGHVSPCRVPRLPVPLCRQINLLVARTRFIKMSWHCSDLFQIWAAAVNARPELLYFDRSHFDQNLADWSSANRPLFPDKVRVCMGRVSCLGRHFSICWSKPQVC